MLETAPGFSILWGRTDNRIDNQKIHSKRIWMAWARLHTPEAHAPLDLFSHLYAALTVIANGMNSVLIPGRTTGGLRLQGRRGILSSTLEGVELFETDGITQGLRGCRRYSHAVRASRSTVERI